MQGSTGRCDRDEGIWSLYVHYPLCARRCRYCDFSTVIEPNFPHHEYLVRVVTESLARRRIFPPSAPRSIYIGGGSPSLWPAHVIAALIDKLNAGGLCDLSKTEITLEANPSDLSLEWLTTIRKGGVNRLSLGLQSLNDRILARLGRVHRADEAIGSFSAARRSGFDNISCDLICGIRGQGTVEIRAEIESLSKLGPEHVSLYGLTLSADKRRQCADLSLDSEDEIAEILELGWQHLASRGYAQYEVSNFARPSRQSIHNSLFWQGYPYLGVGAWAHSMVVSNNSHIHVENPSFHHYMNSRLEEQDLLPRLSGSTMQTSEAELAMLEFLTAGFRTTEGISRSRFQQRFGAGYLDPLLGQLKIVFPSDLLRERGDRIALVGRGLLFADAVSAELAHASKTINSCRRGEKSAHG